MAPLEAHVVVVGGGVAGLACAVALAERSLEVAVRAAVGAVD